MILQIQGACPDMLRPNGDIPLAELYPLVSLQLLPTKDQKGCPAYVSCRLVAARIPLQGVDPERHRLWHQHGFGGSATR